MSPFDYITAGESHGPGLTAVIRNVPAGFKIDLEEMNTELARRKKGYGRGGRMNIESDTVEILAGVRNGETTGAPVCLFIKNKDWENWKNKTVEEFLAPRPGHADLTGGIKYRRKDLRDILERSSARETAIRVAVGAFAKQLLKPFHILIASFVEVFGGIEAFCALENFTLQEIQAKSEESPLRILNPAKENEIKKKIDWAKENGDTLGGQFCVVAENVPMALGSFAHPEAKLDARIAYALMSLQAIKAVEFGIGKKYAYLKGSEAHDEIFHSPEKGFYKKTNQAGGIEGGMSNGERIIVKAVMKPIPTLMKPLKTVNIKTKQTTDAVKERSDITAVPAAAVVAESLLAIEIVKALMERYGFDNQAMMQKHYQEDLRDFEWIE